MDTTTQTVSISVPASPWGYPEIAEGLKVRRIVPNSDGFSPVVTLGKIQPGGKLSGAWTTIVEEELEQNPAHLRSVVHLKDLWEHFLPAPEIAKGLKVRQVIDGKIQDEILTVSDAFAPTKDQSGWALIEEWQAGLWSRNSTVPVFFSVFWDQFVPAYPPVVEGMKVQIRLDGDRLGGAVWTVGEVNGDWTSIVEWEEASQLGSVRSGIGKRVGPLTPIFVPKLWNQFAPAQG